MEASFNEADTTMKNNQSASKLILQKSPTNKRRKKGKGKTKGKGKLTNR